MEASSSLFFSPILKYVLNSIIEISPAIVTADSIFFSYVWVFVIFAVFLFQWSLMEMTSMDYLWIA